MLEKNFVEIIQLIKQAQNRAVRAVNAELINLYWNIGKYINDKLMNSDWGSGAVDELADFIQKNYPELKGFNRRGLYRMKQFYETYVAQELVSRLQLQIGSNQNSEIMSAAGTQFADIRNSLLAKLSWTHHRTIFSRCKSAEEIEFYLKTSIKENYTARELDRQISASFFERAMIGGAKSSPALKEISSEISGSFKDNYIFEFLNLSEPHSESDLQKGLVSRMKNFILELGKDFIFVGEEYKLQVGNGDFYPGMANSL